MEADKDKSSFKISRKSKSDSPIMLSYAQATTKKDYIESFGELGALTYSQQVLSKLESLSDQMNSQNNELTRIKSDLSSMEEKFAAGNLEASTNYENEIKREQSSWSDRSDSESIDEISLSGVELIDYNYIEWSRSVTVQLRRMKLHHFLSNQPCLSEPEAISKDKKVKDAILDLISVSAKAKINVHAYTFTKQLWTIIKLIFYDEYVRKTDVNLSYITRKNVRAISEVSSSFDVL